MRKPEREKEEGERKKKRITYSESTPDTRQTLPECVISHKREYRRLGVSQLTEAKKSDTGTGSTLATGTRMRSSRSRLATYPSGFVLVRPVDCEFKSPFYIGLQNLGGSI